MKKLAFKETRNREVENKFEIHWSNFTPSRLISLDLIRCTRHKNINYQPNTNSNFVSFQFKNFNGFLFSQFVYGIT